MRWFITLLLLVLVLLGGFWLVAADRVRTALGVGPADRAAPAASFAVLEQHLRPDQIREVKLTAPDQPTLVLTRHPDGTWSQPGNWPLREAEVAGLVNTLTTLRSRFVAVPLDGGDADLTAYGLNPAQKPVEVRIESGDRGTTLRFGRPPAEAGEPEFSRPTYLRVEDQPEVIRLGPDVYTALARSPEVYRRRQLLPGVERVKLTGGEPPPNPTQPPPPVGRVAVLGDPFKSVKVERTDGEPVSYTLTRTAPTPAPRRDPNRPAGEPELTADQLAGVWVLDADVTAGKDNKTRTHIHDRIAPDKLRTALTTVPELWVESFVPAGKETGLDKSTRSLTVARADGKSVTVLIGKVAREVTRTEPPPPPPAFGAPPPPPRVTTEEYRYVKLKDNDLVFELRTDKLNGLFADPRELRDAQLARFRADEVNELTVAAKGRPPVTLTRKPGNKDAEKEEDKQDRWYVGDLLAEPAKVTELLDQLARLEARGPENVIDHADAAKLKELEIDPTAGTRVTVVAQAKTADGDAPAAPRTYTFVIGKDDAAKKQLAVRVAGWDRVNLVADGVLKLIDRPALAYRSRRLFDTAELKLHAVTVRRSSGETFALSQQPKPAPETGEHWVLTQPVKADADAAKSAQLAGGLSRLEVAEYVDDAPKPADIEKKYGLAKPRVVVDLGFTGPDAKPRTLEIGADRAGKPEVYARLRDGGSVFTLPKSAVEPLEHGAVGLLPLQLWETTSDRVTGIEVRHGGQEYKLTLAGTDWKLSGPFDAAASFAAVQPLIAAAANVHAEKYDALAADAAKHGLDKPALRLTVTYKEPKSGQPPREASATRTILFGNPTAPGAATRFARLEGGSTQAVFVLPDALFREADKPALARLDKSLLSLDPAQIAQVRIAGPTPDATVTLAKGAAGTWAAAGATFALDKPTVEALVATVARLPVARLAAYGTKVKWADFGLDKPRYTVTVTLNGAKPATHTIVLGKAEPSGERYVRVDGGPAVGVLLPRAAGSLARGKLDFADRTMLAFDPQSLTAIVRAKGKEQLELTQAGLNWQIARPAKAKADRQTVDDLAEQLARLRAVKVAAIAPADLAKPFGLKEPAATLTLKADGDRVLKIGGPVDAAKPAGDRYALAESKGGPVVVGVLAGPLANRLLAEPIKFHDRTLAKFVDADRLTLERDGRKVTFAKVAGTWKVTEPVQADAEQTDLDELVNALANLRADELVAERPADLKPFGLAAPEATWRAFAGDREVLSLLVGAKEKAGSRVYAKTATGTAVALLPPALTNRVFGEYRKRAIWSDLDASQIESLILSTGTANVLFRKGPTGWGDPAKPGEAIDAAKLNETLAALAGLKAERYVADKDAKLGLYGLDRPRRVIVVTQKGGGTKTLQIGGPVGGTDGKQVYAKVGDPARGEVFVLSEADTARLLRDRAAFAGKR